VHCIAGIEDNLLTVLPAVAVAIPAALGTLRSLSRSNRSLTVREVCGEVQSCIWSCQISYAPPPRQPSGRRSPSGPCRMVTAQPEGADPSADAQPEQKHDSKARNNAPLQTQPSGTHEERAASVLQAAYRSHVNRRSQRGMALHKDPNKVQTCSAAAPGHTAQL